MRGNQGSLSSGRSTAVERRYPVDSLMPAGFAPLLSLLCSRRRVWLPHGGGVMARQSLAIPAPRER